MRDDQTLYCGSRDGVGGCPVTVNGRVLLPAASLRVRNHSPTGFNWGYTGSGAAQLALGLLLDFTGDAELAQRLYQKFKEDYVAKWTGQHFQIRGVEIRNWLHDNPALGPAPDLAKKGDRP